MRFTSLSYLLDTFRRRDSQQEISAVYVDVRNFTSFTEQLDSAEVMRFLREYYDRVGDVVTRFGGTIKDYAGDGMLILVGAPRPLTDHADRAVKMALAIREAGERVTSRWAHHGVELGIGIGVASGEVTLGMIGGPARREYAAVGPTINLAARLCARAGKSEILLDADTQALAVAQRCVIPMRAGKALNLKGLATPVPSFAA